LRNSLQRRLLAALPGLCAETDHPAVAHALEAGVKALVVDSGASSEAWAAVKAAVRQAKADSSQPEPIGAQQAVLRRACLERLESLLRPTQWIDEVRAYALGDRWRLDDAMADDPSQTGETRIELVEHLDRQVREQGRVLATRPAEFEALLPELVSNSAQAREEALGRGLGEAIDAHLRRERWRQMVDAYSAASPARRRISFLCGFLAGVAKNDMPLAQEFLEGAVAHSALGPRLPEVESCLSTGAQGAQRLVRALHAGLAPVRSFSWLWTGPLMAAMPPVALAMLLHALADRPRDGLAVAVELLSRRLLNDIRPSGRPAAELLKCGRALLVHQDLGHLATHDLTAGGDSVDQLARLCLKDEGSADDVQATARALAENVKIDLARHRWELGRLLLPALLSTQAVATLDVLLGDPGVALPALTGSGNWSHDRYWPAWLTEVPAGELMAWVRQAPAIRAPRVAALCRFEQAKQASSGDPPQPAWSPLAQDLIDACPDRLPVLKQFAERLVPMSWRGSRAALAEGRRTLFAPYLSDPEAAVAAWAREFDVEARRKVEDLRERDRQMDQQSQTFE